MHLPLHCIALHYYLPAHNAYTTNAIAYLHSYVHIISSTYAHIHRYMQAWTRTGTRMQHDVSSDFICCLEEPHACIFFHQMLAPSNRAQVLF